MDFTDVDKRIDMLSEAIVNTDNAAEIESLVNSLGNTFSEVMFNADDSTIMALISQAIGKAYLKAAYSKE